MSDGTIGPVCGQRTLRCSWKTQQLWGYKLPVGANPLLNRSICSSSSTHTTVTEPLSAWSRSSAPASVSSNIVGLQSQIVHTVRLLLNIQPVLVEKCPTWQIIIELCLFGDSGENKCCGWVRGVIFCPNILWLWCLSCNWGKIKIHFQKKKASNCTNSHLW